MVIGEQKSFHPGEPGWICLNDYMVVKTPGLRSQFEGSNCFTSNIKQSIQNIYIAVTGDALVNFPNIKRTYPRLPVTHL